MGASILVVDDEAVVREFIVATLLPLGHHLVTASDGESALEAALASPPDLVISDVMMPGMDGWSLVRRVRTHPRLAFVPFIFLSALSSVDDILKGFRLGADDYLPKPFRSDALIERVTDALRRRESIESRTRGLLEPRDDGAPPALRGSLSEVGLSSLLVLLEIEKKSGTLELHGEFDERLRLDLRRGRVFQAHVDRGPPLTGAEVIYYLLGWPRGTFVFHAGDAPIEDKIGLSTTGLLMEAARRADEGGGGERDLFDLVDDDAE
ncbi:MAG: response regulator [Myxococcales bacterium]|nr:response regulator [Myxococcales bacterium]